MLPRHTMLPNPFSVLILRDFQSPYEKKSLRMKTTHLTPYKSTSDNCLGFRASITDIEIHKWHHLNERRVLMIHCNNYAANIGIKSPTPLSLKNQCMKILLRHWVHAKLSQISQATSEKSCKKQGCHYSYLVHYTYTVLFHNKGGFYNSLTLQTLGYLTQF